MPVQNIAIPETLVFGVAILRYQAYSTIGTRHQEPFYISFSAGYYFDMLTCKPGFLSLLIFIFFWLNPKETKGQGLI
jgi:hypothetical protein